MRAYTRQFIWAVCTVHWQQQGKGDECERRTIDDTWSEEDALLRNARQTTNVRRTIAKMSRRSRWAAIKVARQHCTGRITAAIMCRIILTNYFLAKNYFYIGCKTISPDKFVIILTNSVVTRYRGFINLINTIVLRQFSKASLQQANVRQANVWWANVQWANVWWANVWWLMPDGLMSGAIMSNELMYVLHSCYSVSWTATISEDICRWGETAR